MNNKYCTLYCTCLKWKNPLGQEQSHKSILNKKAFLNYLDFHIGQTLEIKAIRVRKNIKKIMLTDNNEFWETVQTNETEIIKKEQKCKNK